MKFISTGLLIVAIGLACLLASSNANKRNNRNRRKPDNNGGHGHDRKPHCDPRIRKCSNHGHHNQANIEMQNKFNVTAVKEKFNGHTNHALTITTNKKLVIHNIIEILEMVHHACMKSEKSASTCRAKISDVMQKYANVILDIMELYNFMHFNNHIDLKHPKNIKHAGSLLAHG